MTDVTEKHRREAEAVGLELLGPAIWVGNMLYGSYRLPCGHTKSVQVTPIRNGRKPHCSTCHEKKLCVEASRVNLKLLGPAAGKRTGNPAFRSYLLPCGHVQDVHTGGVRDGTAPRCTACKYTKHVSEAVSAGLVLLGQATGDKVGHCQYRSYLLPCGHIRNLTLVSVRRRSYDCDACREQRFSAEAESHSLVLLGPALSKAKDHYRSYLLPCGHFKDINTWCVRIGTYKCNICVPGSSCGEIAVHDHLCAVGADFEQEAIIQMCDTYRRIDFVVYHTRPDKIWLEFDGKDHFLPQTRSRSKTASESFLDRSLSDHQKNQYALAHNIPLVRIHYKVHERGKTTEAVDQALSLLREGHLDDGPVIVVPEGDDLAFVPIEEFHWDEGAKALASATLH